MGSLVGTGWSLFEDALLPLFEGCFSNMNTFWTGTSLLYGLVIMSQGVGWDSSEFKSSVPILG